MASKKEIRENAYRQMIPQEKKGFNLPFIAQAADEQVLPAGVTPAQKQQLLDKKIGMPINQGTQSFQGRPDLQPQGSLTDPIIDNTAQKIVQNKIESRKPEQTQPSPQPGIDFGGMFKGGLDLLGKGVGAVGNLAGEAGKMALPAAEFAGKTLANANTSDLLGITAGTEAGSRDADVYLASAYGDKSDMLRKQEFEQQKLQAEQDKIRLSSQGVDGQTITVVDPETNKQVVKLIDKNTGKVIKDYGEPGYAGVDPRTIDIAGGKAYAGAVGKATGTAKGQAQAEYETAGYDAGKINQEEKELLEANKNAYSGKSGQLQAGFEKEKTALTGEKASKKLENTALLQNRLKKDALKLAESLKGNLSDKDLAILMNISGSKEDISTVERERAIKEMYRIKREGLQRLAIKAGQAQTQPQENTTDLKSKYGLE